MNKNYKLLFYLFLFIVILNLTFNLKLQEPLPRLVCSNVKLKNYLETEKSVIKDLEKAMWSALSRKMIYRRYLEMRRYEHEDAMQNLTRFIGNPISCFRLIKRLTVDLDYTKKLFRQVMPFDWDKSVQYPTRKDLLEAAVSIARLMQIYFLNPGELSDGIWRTNFSADGRDFNETFQPMSASDCMELGKALYKVNYPLYGLPWVRRGGIKLDPQTFLLDKRYVNEESPESLTEAGHQRLAKILREYSTYQNSFAEKCPDVFKKDHFHATHMAYALYQQVDIESAVKITKETALKKDTPIPFEHVPYFSHEDVLEYERLCSMVKPSVKLNTKTRHLSKLCCFYLSKAQPSLDLVRIKVERVHYKPEILLFYDVITDFESATVLTETEPLLYEAFAKDEEFDFMTADFGWNSSSVMKRMSQKVSRLAGLKVDHTTIVNAMQYSVGGVFDLHFDSWTDEERIQDEGNHLATFMFYLSDVEQGGATVFPSLGLSVFPIKGAALMWTNLLASGLPHPKTIHGGCPVLRGNKWVLTYRLNIRGQEISRPCLLRNRTKELRLVEH